MDIWLDTANPDAVKKATRFGLLCGVTTNPSLIAQSKRTLQEVLEDLLHVQQGPVTAQVISNDVNEMVEQGKSLYSFSNRLIIKIPLTENGLEAIHLLSRLGIPTMGTIVFNARQALLASLAGADYIAPYLGRLEKIGEDPWLILKTIAHLFTTYRLKTKILGASLQTIEHVLKCAEIGICAVTIKENLFKKMIETDDMTQKSIEQFAIDWKSVKPSPFIF
ncbi:MAG: transaldolase family protein [Parachlamydiaceae bacterium]